MNIGALAAENFLWLTSALSVPAFGAALGLRWLSLKGLYTASPQTLASIYAAAVATPPLAAGWIVLAALLPLLSFGDAFHDAHAWATHDDHLLSGLLEPIQPAAQHVAGAAFIALLAGALAAIVRTARRAQRALAILGVTAFGKCTGARWRRLPHISRVRSRVPVCFVWGVRRPHIVVSDGLIAALEPRELRAVLEHEAAHVRRHDNLAKLVLSVLAHTSLLWPLSRRVLRWHSEQTELICDETAAACTASPLALARALVTVHRERAVAVPYAAGLVSAKTGHLERRVCRLLAFADQRARVPVRSSARFAYSLVNVAAIFAVSLAVVYVVAPLGVHAIAELLLHRLP